MMYLRPVVALGLLLITPLPGRAESPRTPQANLAAVMEGAGQALLYDRIQDAYVLVRVGDGFQGFLVAAIERNQLILATATTPPLQFVLPKVSELFRLDDGGHSISARPAVSAPPTVVRLSPEDLAPIDPYGEQSTTVIDPYSEPPISTVVAPAASRASSDPEPATPSVAPATPQVILTSQATSSPAIPAGPAATDLPVPTPPRPAVDRPKDQVQPLIRAEFDAALEDFDALSREVKLVVGTNDVEITELAPGTFLHRLGLRTGDRVLRVAGQPINSLDAAAAVYARLMSAKEFSVVVVRDRQNLTLRYRFAG